MKRILVPLDGSSLSEAAVPLAEGLARDHEADLLLVRALRSMGSPEAEFRAQEEAEAYLDAVARSLRARGLPGVEWKVWYDEPERAIALAAWYNKADLIAMSTHGRGGLSRLLFGSVAESLVRKAPVPVVLVSGRLPRRPVSIGRVLVPLDGSELSEGILPVVEGLAGPLDVAIDLLRVVEPIPGAAAVELPVQARELLDVRAAEAERYLGKIATVLEAKGLRVRAEVREGPAVDAILRYAVESGVGLIAMSTHGRTGLGRLLIGSVAERVLRAGPVPVVIWKPSVEGPDR